MLVLVVWLVVLDADDYFALVAFQMAWPTLQTITMHHCQEKVVHVLLLVVWLVVFYTDNYFALVAFQMARPTLQTITMRHCQEKVVHVLLLVVRFVVLNAHDYFTLVAFQMSQPTLYIAWHTILSTGNYDVHMHISMCFLIEFCWSITMWNKIFQRVNLLVILLNFWVLPKGHQSCQITTMLHNECTHTFLYVFGHCGEYMLRLLLISKLGGGGGVSLTLLSAGAIFFLEVLSHASSQQHG